MHARRAAGPAVQIEQGIVGRDEIADLRDELDSSFRSLGLCLQRFEIDRHHNGRRSLVRITRPGDQD